MIRFKKYQRIFLGSLNLLVLIILTTCPTFQFAQVYDLEHKLNIADSLYETRDYAKTDIYLDQLVQEAQDSGSIDIESRAIYIQGKVKHNTYYRNEAIELYQNFKQCRVQSHLPYDTFLYHRNIAVCYAYISKPDIALNHFDTAFTYLDKDNNLETGNYFGGLAFFFGNNNHDSLALELTRLALTHFEAENLISSIIWYQYDMAFYAEKLGKYEESIQHLDTVLSIATQEKDTMAIWMGLACMGINEIKLERYERGIYHMEQAAELEDIFDQKLCCANDVFIALGYGKLGQLSKMDIPLTKALSQLPEVVDLHDRLEVYGALSDVYNILGDDKQALRYYKMYRQLDDSIANRKYLDAIAQQQVKLEHNKLLDQIKNTEILHQVQQSKYTFTKKMLFLALIAFLISLALYIINLRKLQSYKYDYKLWLLAFENNTEAKDSENPHNLDAQWLQIAKGHVLNNLNNESFKVADLAKLLSMTPRELNTRLNGTLQMTANKFIRTIRIEHAKELLLKKSKTISEISYEVGFSDSAYFSRVFKAATGLAPKNWLTEHRKVE